MKPEQWIINGVVGTSSKTIWAVMMDAVLPGCKDSLVYGVPRDPNDFRRCWKLLVLFPEWRTRLSEVAIQFPAWVGFVREWDKLTAMFEALLAEGEYYSPEMYCFMKELEEEGMLADGWIKKSASGWSRDRPVHPIR